MLWLHRVSSILTIFGRLPNGQSKTDPSQSLKYRILACHLWKKCEVKERLIGWRFSISFIRQHNIQIHEGWLSCFQLCLICPPKYRSNQRSISILDDYRANWTVEPNFMCHRARLFHHKKLYFVHDEPLCRQRSPKRVDNFVPDGVRSW